MAVYRKASIDSIKLVVEEKQAVRFLFESHKGSVYMDSFSASAILQVYNALNIVNQAKIERMVKFPAGLDRVLEIAMQSVGG